MAKHTQTIRRQFANEYWSVFGHFVNLAFKGLIYPHTGPVEELNLLTEKNP